MMRASAPDSSSESAGCRGYLVVLAFLLSALLSGLSATRVAAQVLNWPGGTVEVSETSLTIKPGEAVSYSIRLSQPPAVDGVLVDNAADLWFVMLYINGVKYTDGEYKDLKITPLFYRDFNKDNWNVWKNFSVKRLSDEEWNLKGGGPRATSVRFTHEVWNHESNCPVHNAGRVTVSIGGNGNPNPNPNLNPGDGGNNGGGGRSPEDANGGGDAKPGDGSDGSNGGGGRSPDLTIADAVSEEGKVLAFVVTLDRRSSEIVTVRYETADGTASDSTDYEAASGILTFVPGGALQRTIEVQTLEDALDEPSETLSVRLHGPVGAALEDNIGTGTIVDNDDPVVRFANRIALPEIGRALAFTATRCRLEKAFSDLARGGWAKPSASSLLPPAPAHGMYGSAGDRPLDLKQLFGKASFLVPLSREERKDTRFAMWACSDYRLFDDGSKNGAPAWDGEAFNMQFGVEIRLRPNMLAGVSVSRSLGEFEYGGADGAASYDVRLNGIHPYLGLLVSPGLEMWGVFGLGRGTIQVSDSLVPGSLSTDVTLASGALGVNSRLLARGPTTLTAKGELALARLGVSDVEAFGNATANLRRIRLAVEGDHEWVVPDAGVLAPRAELGLRHDGGAGESGTSLEVGGGLHYRNIEQAWNSEIYGRWVGAQGDARPDEIGFGAQLHYDPAAPGFGPWAGLTLNQGEVASSVHQLWEDRPTNPDPRDISASRLDAKIAYGFAALGGRGVLTPYGAFSFDRQYGRSYRFGGSFSAGPSASLVVEAEQQMRRAGSNVLGIGVRATFRF